MKNLSILLAVLSVSALPVGASEPLAPNVKIEESIQIQQKLGSQAIAEIRQAYENGDYDVFLKELDDSYLSARDKNQLTQLIEMREGVSDDWAEWDDQARRLQELKGKELIAAVEDEKDSLFKEKVISSATQFTSSEQEGALFRIAALRQMAPNTGKSSDENKLIDLDLEYEYKSLHLSMPGQPTLNKAEKQMVLRMERAKKMGALSADFKDASLKKDVNLYLQDLDLRLAQNWDSIDLNALANGRTKPISATEEKVASILNQYQEKFSGLAKQFIAEREAKQ